MYLRKRKFNLSIERATYEPAKKDALGNIVKPAVRSTRYIGSLPSFAPFSDVPKELLQQLTEVEKQELKEALKKNEPTPFGSLDHIPTNLENAAFELRNCVREHGAIEAKKLLDQKIRAADAAWAAFFRAAQDLGLKRNRRVTKKPKVLTQAQSAQSDVQS